jgi:hypothetical protein
MGKRVGGTVDLMPAKNPVNLLLMKHHRPWEAFPATCL